MSKSDEPANSQESVPQSSTKKPAPTIHDYNKLATDQEISDLNIRNASTIYNDVTDEVNFLVDDLITEGVNVLSGPPKCGKSTLAFQIAVAVAKGDYVLWNENLQTQHFKCQKKSNVLILSYEESEKKFKQRLLSIEDGKIPDNMDYKTDWTPDFPDGDDTVNETITAFDHVIKKHKYKLLVIDTYIMMYNRFSQEGGSYKKEYQFVEGIKNLANKHNLSILLLHHTVKSTNGDWVKNLYGSQALSGGVDTIHFLDRERESVNAILRITGRDLQDSSHGLYFDKDKALWRYYGNADYLNCSNRQREILAVLEKGPTTSTVVDFLEQTDKPDEKKEKLPEFDHDKIPNNQPPGTMYLRDIARKTYSSSSSVNNILLRLIDKGLVKKMGQGLYISKKNLDKHRKQGK